MCGGRPGRGAHLLGIFLSALALYLATAAPTVLWGDSAELQRLAAAGGELNPGRGGHLLWLGLARLLQWIPAGEPAWRAGLLSALAGAFAAMLAGAAAGYLCGRRRAAWYGAGALALSHTFWLHAVQAEVYTLHLVLYAAVLLLALSLLERPERSTTAITAALLAGVGVSNHLLMVSVLPALAYALWRGRPAGSRRLPILPAIAFLAGASPWLFLTLPAAAGHPILRPLSNLSLSGLFGRSLPLGAAFTLYQFPLSLPLAAAGLVAIWKRRAETGRFLLLAWGGAFGFALLFQARDQFVFFLPSYLVLSILIGFATGIFQAPSLRSERIAMGLILFLTIAVAPALLYSWAPRLEARLGSRPIPVRSLPGREASFFLTPSKRGYTGALRFSEEAFAAMPPGSAILADWTPAQALLYLQEVEGRRPDITVKQLGAGWGLQAPWLGKNAGTSDLFLAAVNPIYYDIQEIQAGFEILPAGPIFRLLPRAGTAVSPPSEGPPPGIGSPPWR